MPSRDEWPDDAADPRVRPVRSTDAPAVRALHSRLREPSPTLLESALDGVVGTLLVSVSRGDVVGYLLGLSGGALPAETGGDAEHAGARAADAVTEDASQVDEVGTDRPGEADAAHVAELVVAPEYRRDGRASGLLATFQALVAAPLTVTVAADDERARAFYAAAGFEERRRLPETFDDGDALLLRRGV